jgi:AcrR family transcriptional regulator
MSNKEYSCVRKTKNAFAESLIELSKEKQLNKISVKEICQGAQLSRNAFYFHYNDINDLIAEIENDVISEIKSLLEHLEKIPFPKNVYDTIDCFVDIFEARKDTVMMLMDKSFSTSFTTRISLIFGEFNYKYFREFNGDGSKTSFEFFYVYLSGGLYDTIRYWLDNQDKMDKASFNALCYILVKRLLLPINPDLEDIVKK